MQTYDSYKNSGIDWLGEIPSHWELYKLKFLFTEKRKTLNPNLPAGSISFGEVVFKDDEKIPESTKATYQEVLAGDYLINPLNLNYDLISLRIALSKIDVVVSSGYIVLQDITDINKEYYRWLLHQYDVAYMKLLGSGVRQTISFNHITNSLLPTPPISEQEAIATFLDEKCGKIDELVSVKEQQIALLKECRQVVIHEAVTKGLQPNMELKDSGIDWIGEILSHWEVKRLKYVFNKILTGTTPSTTNEKYFDGEISWYNPKDLNNEILDSSEKKVSELAIKDGSAKLFVGDSVLIVGIGATAGKTSYLKSKGTFNQQITGFYSSLNYNLFYFYYMKSISKVMLSLAQFTTLPILNNEFFKKLFLPVPPISEQEAIVAYLDEQTGKIDQAIALKTEQIEKLKAYKQSLINEVVTGKVKVA